ncbi:MAG TPA: Pr6Pr family membrane protein [Sphingomonas sp.]|nr:Pr6Pr family membrane protein [Sphingomonas sp.]
MGIESRAARAVAGAIALVGCGGLAAQFSATFDLNGSIAGTVWILARYFTILTNILAALVLTGVALGRPAFRAPILLGGVTLATLLVGVIYSLLLRGLHQLSGAARLADLILHDVVPVLVSLFWLFLVPKRALSIRAPFLWALYPLAYLVYALARGAVERRYAYPFIDIAQIGWPQAAINILAIMLGFLAAAFALVWLDRLIGPER